MKKHKQALLAFIVICITVSISGCLDVNLGKELFGKKAIPLEVHFKIVTKANLSHTFNTLVPQSIAEEEEFEITKKTERLLVNIKVNIKTIPELEAVPELLQLAQQYLEMPRYVTVILTLPNGSVYFNESYNETGEETLPPIDYPTLGKWKLRVEASGIGYQGYEQYSDSYSVQASARETI